MRVAAASLSCSAMLTGFLLRAKAEQMADGVSQLGAVQRVEMELADAAGIELAAQFGGDGGGDQLARGGEVVEPLEQPVHPRRDRGAAARRELAGLGDVGDGEDAGDELGVDARSGGLVAEAEEAIGREEELGDGAVGAGVDLA